MIERTPILDETAAAAAEHQMRNWAKALEVQQRLKTAKAAPHLPPTVHPYIAISRETGAGGGTLANRLAEVLGWRVLGRELLDRIALRYGHSRTILDSVDETTPNWIAEIFGRWLDRQLVTPSQYLRHLGRVVLLAAQAESSIFVGRGAQFFLPAASGISVRLVAPLEVRVARIMELHGWDHRQAEAFIRQMDGKRKDFVAGHFRHSSDDPHLYDLTLNRRYIDIEAAAAMIVEDVRRRFAPTQHEAHA
jgi:cytidylate kinase